MATGGMNKQTRAALRVSASLPRQLNQTHPYENVTIVSVVDLTSYWKLCGFVYTLDKDWAFSELGSTVVSSASDKTNSHTPCDGVCLMNLVFLVYCCGVESSSTIVPSSL